MNNCSLTPISVVPHYEQTFIIYKDLTLQRRLKYLDETATNVTGETCFQDFLKNFEDMFVRY